MRTIAVFFLYLLGCMLLSAALLPWLYPVFEATLGATPDRALYRFAMFLGLLGMPLLLRALHLRGRETMGFAPLPYGWQRALIRGLLFGALILTGLVIALLLSGAREFTPRDITPALVVNYALSGLASGLAVGLIEEFFFRGPMHSGARRQLSFWPTALLIGVFYSMVHFMRPIAPLGEEITLGVALDMMFGGFARLGDFAGIADRFVALLVAGVFLSMVRERTGSIVWAIGIHAGWVMIIKLGKKLTVTAPDAANAWLVSGDGITGWLSTAWMALIAAAYWYLSDPKRRKPA